MKFPISLPKDIQKIFPSGEICSKIENRSLLMDRYALPEAKEELRRAWYQTVQTAKCYFEKAQSWPYFLLQSRAKILFGRLRSRLLVNTSGTVMENAGLALDRYGIPYIPGSAVKGCARRMALLALQEWCHKRTKPNGDPCCEPFDSCEQMLTAIALVFGWVPQDWIPRRKAKSNEPQSDFWWAMARDPLDQSADSVRNQNWDDIGIPVIKNLLHILEIPKEKQKHPDAPWKDLPSFAGMVSFFPAYVCSPEVHLNPTYPNLGTLTLDIVNCHHKKYYAGEIDEAMDIEDPEPIPFLAVEENQLFVFGIGMVQSARPIFQRSRDLFAKSEPTEIALTWLRAGLETVGIGAKTNAGYGWFDCSENNKLQSQVKEIQKKQEEQKRLASLPPEERYKIDYLNLSDNDFAEKAKQIQQLSQAEKIGFVLALKDKKKRDTAKRWAKKKPQLLKPWQEFAKTLNPPIELP